MNFPTTNFKSMAQTTEIQRIIQLLKANFDGAAWYGDSLMTVLNTISYRRAARQKLKNGHTIWELVLHITAWRVFLIEKLQGNNDFNIILGSPDFDWRTPTDISEKAWTQTLADLAASQEKIIALLENTNDLLLPLHAPSLQYSYTFYELLHGVLQHDVYHLGQIGILKK
jgi:uncharacterized damage-inducible protein DinB